MATFLSDTFTDTNGTELDAHTGETGATWTKIVGDAAADLAINGNRIYLAGGTEKIYTASGSPASADYEVRANVDFLTTVGSLLIGIVGRCDGTGANRYQLRLQGFDDLLTLGKVVGASSSDLGSVAWTQADHEIALVMDGDQISAEVNGSTVIGPVTDTGVTAAGKAGVYGFGDAGGTADFFMLFDIAATDVAAGGPSQRFMWSP